MNTETNIKTSHIKWVTVEVSTPKSRERNRRRELNEKLRKLSK